MKSTILLIAGLAGSALAAGMPGSDPCTQGPSMWCASKANAQKCGQTAADCAKYCQNASEYPDIQDGDICKPVVGSDPCTYGPSYWCASQANAQKCKFNPSDCAKYCANSAEYPDIQKGDICNQPAPPMPPMPGSNPCTQGPSFWCASEANAKKCNYDPSECAQYCENANEYPGIQDGDICKPTVGKDPCTEGPSFFCASFENALHCKANVTECADKYCGDKEYKDIQDGNICSPAKNQTKCLEGFDFICTSKKHAKLCQVNATECLELCDDKDYPAVGKGSICKPPKPTTTTTTFAPAPTPGNNPCTQGPSYFCASAANAKKCGVAPASCSKYCTNDYPEVLNGGLCPPGSNKCTQGPSYFCASAANAKECNVDPSTCTKYCNSEYPDVQNGDLCQ